MKRFGVAVALSSMLLACGGDEKAMTVMDAMMIPDEGDGAAPPSDAGPLDAGPETRVLASSGGTVTSEDGLFSLEIAPGALAADTTISIKRLDDSAIPADVAATSPISGVYAVEPDGLTFGGDGATVRYRWMTAPAGLVTAATATEPEQLRAILAHARPTAGGAITDHATPHTSYFGDGSVEVTAQVAHLSLHWTTDLGVTVGDDLGAQTHNVGDQWTGLLVLRGNRPITNLSYTVAVTSDGIVTEPRASGSPLPGGGYFYHVATPTLGLAPNVGHIIRPRPAWACRKPSTGGKIKVKIELTSGTLHLGFTRERRDMACVAATPPPARATWLDESACTRHPGGEIGCTALAQAIANVTLPATTTPSLRIEITQVRSAPVANRTDGPTTLVVSGGTNGATATLDTSGATPQYTISGVAAGTGFDATQQATWTSGSAPAFNVIVPTGALPTAVLGTANGLQTDVRVPSGGGFTHVLTELRLTDLVALETLTPVSAMPMVGGEYVAPIASDAVDDYIAASSGKFMNGRVCMVNLATDETLLPAGMPIEFISGRCVTFDAMTLMPPAATDCADRPEICDGVDNNCNKRIDEGCPTNFGMSANVALTSPYFGSIVSGQSSSSNSCSTYGIVTGLAGRQVASIWQLAPYCAGMQMRRDTTTLPYQYTMAVTTPRAPGMPFSGSTGGGTGSRFDITCPPNTIAHKIIVTMSTDPNQGLGTLQLECVPWLLTRRAGNVWRIIEGQPMLTAVAGAGPGALVPPWTAPIHSSGVPMAFNAVPFRYQISHPIQGVQVQAFTGILTR